MGQLQGEAAVVGMQAAKTALFQRNLRFMSRPHDIGTAVGKAIQGSGC
jgi:hypothetical protein